MISFLAFSVSRAWQGFWRNAAMSIAATATMTLMLLLLAGLRRVLDCDAAELATMSARCREDALGFDGDGYAEAVAEMIRALPDRPS